MFQPLARLRLSGGGGIPVVVVVYTPGPLVALYSSNFVGAGCCPSGGYSQLSSSCHPLDKAHCLRGLFAGCSCCNHSDSGILAGILAGAAAILTHVPVSDLVI